MNEGDIYEGDSLNEKEKAGHEAYMDRLSVTPSPVKLTEEEIEELKKQGRI